MTTPQPTDDFETLLLKKQARDLTAAGLRNVIADGVYRGAMKAVGICALISTAVAVFLWLLRVISNN